MGPAVRSCLKLSQGDLEHRRAVASQGPGPQPAAIAAVIDADDLIQLAILAPVRELDAVALVQAGGGAGHGSAVSNGGGVWNRKQIKARGGRGWGRNGAGRSPDPGRRTGVSEGLLGSTARLSAIPDRESSERYKSPRQCADHDRRRVHGISRHGGVDPVAAAGLDRLCAERGAGAGAESWMVSPNPGAPDRARPTAGRGREKRLGPGERAGPLRRNGDVQHFFHFAPRRCFGASRWDQCC